MIGRERDTTLEAAFKLWDGDAAARELKYTDLPESYTFHKGVRASSHASSVSSSAVVGGAGQ